MHYSRQEHERRGQRFRLGLALLALLAALTAPAVATADPPPGFVSHPELAQRVQFIVDHPINVYCATNDDAFTQLRAAHGSTTEAVGFAFAVGGVEMFLTQSTCRAPLAKVTSQSFGWSALSQSLFTIAHEAEHLAGHRDEHETDCAALAVIRQVAWSFGVRKSVKVAQVARYAAQVHAIAPPGYAGPC